jgi:hypothetical protein
MNTKLLMTISSIFMGLTGIVLSFFPQELLIHANFSTGLVADGLVIQILGALYFAFAMVNWTAKANLIGGIYSRPIAIGNLIHFTMGVLALIKGFSSSHPLIFQMATLIYIVFAIAFGIVFF